MEFLITVKNMYPHLELLRDLLLNQEVIIQELSRKQLISINIVAQVVFHKQLLQTKAQIHKEMQYQSQNNLPNPQVIKINN